ncbi:MAG: GAF domain-containing protein [candidate division Zixibacteria bacterium]
MTHCSVEEKILYREVEKMRKRVIELSTSEQRDFSDQECEAILELISMIYSTEGSPALPRTLMTFLRNWSGCEAVGVRLRYGYDFPYYETRGFPDDFVLAENKLCVTNENGEIVKDHDGNPILECMCGNVIAGRFDPEREFFTEYGSFWTNSTSELLANISKKDRQDKTRNRCNGAGYESVALIPLRMAGEGYGLLQFNDKRKGMFTLQKISLLERIAANITFSLAKCKDETQTLLILNEKEILLHQIYKSLKIEPEYSTEPV